MMSVSDIVNWTLIGTGLGFVLTAAQVYFQGDVQNDAFDTTATTTTTD